MNDTILLRLIENGGAAAVASLLMAAMLVTPLVWVLRQLLLAVTSSLHELTEKLGDLVTTQVAANSVISEQTDQHRQLMEVIEKNHTEVMKAIEAHGQ